MLSSYSEFGIVPRGNVIWPSPFPLNACFTFSNRSRRTLPFGMSTMWPPVLKSWGKISRFCSRGWSHFKNSWSMNDAPHFFPMRCQMVHVVRAHNFGGYLTASQFFGARGVRFYWYGKWPSPLNSVISTANFLWNRCCTYNCASSSITKHKAFALDI